MNRSDPTASSVTLRYLLVLGFLALMAVVGHLVLQEQIGISHQSALALNMASRQRFLVQRSASLAEQLAEASDPSRQSAIRNELTETLRRLESSHQGLTQGSSDLGPPLIIDAPATPLTLEAEQGADSLMRQFLTSAQALLAAPSSTLNSDNPHLATLRQIASHGQLLGAQDRAVETLQRQYQDQLQRVRRSQWLTLAGMLGAILLIGLVVVYPLQRRISEEMGKLTELNSTLEQRVAERSAAAEQRAAELARSRATLEEQTGILKSILDGMSDGVVVVDRQGAFLLFNAAAETMLGVGSSDTPPERWSEHYRLYLPDRVTPFPSDELPLIRALRGEAVDRCEMFVRLGSGSAGVWFTVAARPLLDDRGEPRGAVAVMQDATRRKQAEAALRESEALYQSLIEALPLNFFRKDLDGAFTFANQRFCDTVGCPLDDLLGKTDFDLFPVELAEKYLRDDHRVIDTSQPFEDIEQHRRADGKLLYVQVLKAPVYDAERTIIGTQGIFWDVTERQRKTDQMSQRS